MSTERGHRASTAWNATETFAWTEHDGPGSPPSQPWALMWVVAGALLVGTVTLMANDSLCPEHRAWIQVLGAVAVVGSVTAAIALIRRRPTAAYWTVIPATCGIAIGFLDATHDPGRGQIIVLAFGAALIVVGAVAVRVATVSRWASRVERAHRLGQSTGRRGNVASIGRGSQASSTPPSTTDARVDEPTGARPGSAPAER